MVVCCQGSLSAVVSKNIRMNNLVVRGFFLLHKTEFSGREVF